MDYIFKFAKSLCILCFCLLACNSEMPRNMQPKSVALGKYNEIVVVADNNVWDGMVGDSFRFYFASAYPIMPSPEPLFDLRHYTPEDLTEEPLRKELRTYAILADLSDSDSPTTRMVKRDIGDARVDEAIKNPSISSTVGRDKWANGQLMIYLFGKDPQTLASTISSNFTAATKRVHEHDAKMLKQRTYARDLDFGLQAKLNEYFGVDLGIPQDYREAKFDEVEPMLWLRKDSDEAIMNLVFMKIPYTSKTQFTKPEIIGKINDYGMKYVTSDVEDNAYVVNEDDLPVYEYTSQIDGQFSKELRGLWEMSNSFSGGPFTANAITSKDGKSVVLVLAYVFAPGKDKRNLMQQLDFMVKSIKLKAS